MRIRDGFLIVVFQLFAWMEVSINTNLEGMDHRLIQGKTVSEYPMIYFPMLERCMINTGSILSMMYIVM